MAFLCSVILLRGEMLVLIVKLKYKVQHCKRLFEFIRRISWNHRCNYGLLHFYSVISHGAAAQLSLKWRLARPLGV